MHHSGTSFVSNLTMMMGAYGGEHGEFILHATNPMKYWERRDVVEIDRKRISSGVRAHSERYGGVPKWIGYGFDPTKEAIKVDKSLEAKEIVQKLNARRPWVTKDPRMCLLADEWMRLLDAPVCVITHRDPVDLAHSMTKYAPTASLEEWASIYSAYYSSAMRACAGRPTVVVQHAEITKDPYNAVKKLHNALVAAGVRGLTLPAESRVTALLSSQGATESPFYLASERRAVGKTARAISTALSKGAVATDTAPDKPKWFIAPRRGSEAIATLLTTSNEDYLRGALALGSSVSAFEPSRHKVVLVTKAVPTEWHILLKEVGWSVLGVEEVEEFWFDTSTVCSNHTENQGERWGHMATKLRLWQLTQFSRVLYMDADTALTAPVSNLFHTVKTFAAERPRFHAGFNAGVMMLTPSERVFNELLAVSKGKPASLFNSVVDCTEQGLLNTYFDGSEGREVTKIAVGRADVKADWSSDTAPFAVHWITQSCPKPWLVADKVDAAGPDCDDVAYDYWQRVSSRTSVGVTIGLKALPLSKQNSARRKLSGEYDAGTTGGQVAACPGGCAPCQLASFFNGLGLEIPWWSMTGGRGNAEYDSLLADASFQTAYTMTTCATAAQCASDTAYEKTEGAPFAWPDVSGHSGFTSCQVPEDQLVAGYTHSGPVAPQHKSPTFTAWSGTTGIARDTAVPPWAPLPVASSSSEAGSSGDPHLHLAKGGKADFRGVDGTSYVLLSGPGFSFAGTTLDATFLLPRPMLVEGSFFVRAAWRLRGRSGAEYGVLADANALSARVVRLERTGAGEDNATVLKTLDGVWQEWKADGLKVYQKQSSLFVRGSGYETNVTRKPIYNYVSGPSHWRYDVAVRPLDGSTGLEGAHGRASATCFPHGLLGQSYDGSDVAVDGKMDDYRYDPKKPVVRTSAMAEGAIEGVAADYAVSGASGASPYRAAFKFSRYHKSAADSCAPRDPKTLSGAKRAADKKAVVAGTTSDDDLLEWKARR